MSDEKEELDPLEQWEEERKAAAEKSGRKLIHEKDRLHEKWYARARKIKTNEELVDLIERMESYQHDYGTIIHAMVAVALAGIHRLDSGAQGGITGYQAGAIFWQFWAQWLASEDGKKCGARLVNYENMLYPQYAEDFEGQWIRPTTFESVCELARENLEKEKGNDRVAERVRAHWQSLADGELPFGMRLKGD